MASSVAATSTSVISALAPVQRELDNLFSSQALPSWDEQLQAVRRLAQPARFISLLESVLDSEAALQEIASRSYVHPNRFDKISLISSSIPDYKLRLHIWWPSSEDGFTESVHNHQWTLSSVVLLGSLHSQDFMVGDQGPEYLHYTYSSRPGLSNRPELTASPVALSCVSDTVLATGSYYVLSTEVLHRVISDPRNMTATLMLQGPANPNTVVHIYTDEPIYVGEGVESPETFSNDVLSDKLRRLLQSIR